MSKALECEASVIDPSTGRRSRRCPSPPAWRLVRKFSGLATVLCEQHKQSTYKPGAFDVPERLKGGAGAAR